MEFGDLNGFLDSRFSVTVSYSGKFNPFNANVRRRGNLLEFNLSDSWNGVSDDIVFGLLQSLSARVLKLKSAKTLNMELYENFVKSLQLAYPKTRTDAVLESCFEEVNKKYFEGLMEKPNFAWHSSVRRLASYDHHTDTVSVSDVFKGRPDIMEYLVYHELLHRKLKFRVGVGRVSHHGSRFRELERVFTNSEQLEREISLILRRARRAQKL